MDESRHRINVLHVLDMAGGSSIQCHFWRKLGLGKSWLLHRQKDYPTPVIDHYGIAELFPRLLTLVMHGIKRARNPAVDIVMIHGGEVLVPIFKLLSGKKVVLQYHGSDINIPCRSRNPVRILARSMADAIIYNQKAHRKKIITVRNVHKEYHVNAVDTDLFCSPPSPPPTKARESRGGKVAFLSGNLDCEKTSELLEKFDDLTVVDMRKEGIRPYNKIPELLGKFEMLVDLKVTKYGLVPTLSMLALQALACGCKVYTFENEIKQGLPERHTPEVVMGRLYDLFLRLINGDRLT